MAASSGRSEAQLIREAITALARASDRPRPKGRLFACCDPSPTDDLEAERAGSGDR
jgi:hypothetical protein